MRRDGMLDILKWPPRRADQSINPGSLSGRPLLPPFQYSPDSKWLLAPANATTAELIPLKNQPISLEASPGQAGRDTRADFSQDSRRCDHRQ